MLKAIIFDVDGVLLDSFEANFQFYTKLLAEFGHPGPRQAVFRTVTHMSMGDAIKTLTGLTDDVEIEKIWARGRQPFDQFDDVIEAHMPLGATEIVQTLAVSYKLGIVTSRIKSHIFEGDFEKIKKYFQTIIGYEDTLRHKPDPEPLLKAAKELGVEPSECVYIGDALTDVQAGAAAGMEVISYGNKSFPGTVGHARSFGELPVILEKLFK